MTEPVPETASYFGLLADLSDATLQLRKGDWERARDCHEAGRSGDTVPLDRVAQHR